MYGDRFGSPGRDDRQDGTEPHGPWDDARFPENQPPSDDVKVAGSPLAPQPERPDLSGATSAMPIPEVAETAPVDDLDATRHDFGVPPLGGPQPPYGPGPVGNDDFESMRRKPRASGRLIKIGAIAAAAAVVVGGGTAAFALTGGDSGPAKKAAAAEPSAQSAQAEAQPAPMTEKQRKSLETARRKELQKRALRAARSEKDRPSLLAKGEPIPTKTPTPTPPDGSAGNPVPAGEAQQIAKAMLPSFGFDPNTQFGCLVNMWNRESGWRVTAANPSGAYGIPQALPGSKMATAGSDWRTSARTQIKWGLGYIQGRYNTPCGAWAYWQKHKSY